MLAIRGGIDLTFARCPGSDGLQLIGKNQTGASRLHLTLTVTDAGLPLGVLAMGVDRVQKLPEEGARRRKTKRWLRAFSDTAGAADGRIEIEGLTVEPNSSRKQTQSVRKKRLATCELRFPRVSLPATTGPDAEPVVLSGVHIRETAPPEGEDPVEWFLLTTVEVRSAKVTAEIFGYYLQRRRVEDFFRVLKSGCRVEFLLFRTADLLARAITINAVIAWRILVMTLLGPQVPDCEPQLMFSDGELAFLRGYASWCGLTEPDQLGDAVGLVAHLGGYLDRRYDPDPGNQIM